MPTINRVIVDWTGFVGAPGVSVFYRGAVFPDIADITAFFANLAGYFPGSVTIQLRPQGDTIDVATGVINGIWSGAPQAAVSGSSTGDYASPVGAVVNWLTTAIVAGRHLRGKTFLVPLSGSAFDSDGSLDPTHLAGIKSAAAQYITDSGGDALVYSKPRPGVPGSESAIYAATVPDKAAILKSRRD